MKNITAIQCTANLRRHIFPLRNVAYLMSEAVLFLFFLIDPGYTQNTQKSDTTGELKVAKRAVFLELLGSSTAFYSLNYERRIWRKNKNTIWGRFGGGYYWGEVHSRGGSNVRLAMVGEVNYFYGRKHNVGFGIGIRYATFTPNGRSFRLEDFNIYDVDLLIKPLNYMIQEQPSGFFMNISGGVHYQFLRYYYGDFVMRNTYKFNPLLCFCFGYSF